MAITTNIWEQAPMEPKIQFIVEMFREKYPNLRLEIRHGMGDYTDFYFEGITRHRVSNTFLATASPSDIYRELEKTIGYKPMGESKIRQKGNTTGNAWVDEWAAKHGKE